MDIKKTLKNIIELYKSENEDLEQDDCNETVLYELFMNRDSKQLIIDNYTESLLADGENILFSNIDDNLEVIIYNDGYKGYKLKLEAVSNNTLKVISSEEINEDVIDSINDEQNCKLINNL